MRDVVGEHHAARRLSFRRDTRRQAAERLGHRLDAENLANARGVRPNDPAARYFFHRRQSLHNRVLVEFEDASGRARFVGDCLDGKGRRFGAYRSQNAFNA